MLRYVSIKLPAHELFTVVTSLNYREGCNLHLSPVFYPHSSPVTTLEDIIYQPVKGFKQFLHDTAVKIVPSTKDPSGRILVISITGNTNGRTAYLGCSFYPSKFTSKLKEGSHEIVQVSNAFTKTWEIPEKFYQGSFEIALWGNRVMKNRCGSNDCFLCRRFGYHLDTMLDFCSGTLLVTKPVTLRISIAENTGFISVTVNGDVQNGNVYLGVSFYPYGCRDSLKEGRFDCRQVKSGFSEIWTIPERFKGGRYDIALWNNDFTAKTP